MKSKKNKKHNLKTNSNPNIFHTNFLSAYLVSTMSSNLPLKVKMSSNYLALNKELLSSLYLKCPITQRVIKQLVENSLRGGVTIHSEELGNKTKEITNFLEENSILEVVKHAFIWSRLYGGSVILINSTDNKSNKELNLAKVNKDTKLEFYTVSRNCIEEENGLFKLRLENNKNILLHKSRVIRVKNKEVPPHLTSLFKGWGVIQNVNALKNL